MLGLAAVALSAAGIAGQAERADQPRTGIFCVGASTANFLSAADCVAVEGELIAIEPFEEPKKWVWLEEGGPFIAVGLLPPGTSEIALPNPKGGHLQFRLTGDRESGWPSGTDIRIFQETGGPGAPDGDGWTFTLPATRSDLPLHLHLPPGAWRLIAEAPGHLPAIRERLRTEKGALDLGTLALERAPRVLIYLTDGTGPLAGAMLLDPSQGEALAVSDPTGRIEWQPERGELPAELTIEASGFAPKFIDVRERRADLVLDPLILGRGGALRVLVERPPTDEPIEIELIRNQRRRNAEGKMGQVVASATLGEQERELTFELVESGRYSLHLDGEGQLEHWADYVEVTEEETEVVEITLEPFDLELRITFDGQPLIRATVDVGTPTAPGPEWKGSIQTNDEGIASAIAWQRSVSSAWIRSDAPRVESLEWFRLEGEGDETIEIAIRNIKLTGSVVDQETGHPMANLRANVRWSGSGGAGLFVLTTDENGTFEKGALKPGSYTVSIASPDYLPLAETFELSAEVPQRHLDLALERGGVLYVRVVDEAGSPMANATIMELAPPPADAPRIWQADARGVAAIPMSADTRRLVWYAASGGTFGRAVLEGSIDGTEGAPHPLVMPLPAGSITIVAVDQDGSPLSSVWLAVQHDKIPLPTQLVRLMATLRGISFRTSLDGTVTIPNMPKGLYEWWVWKTDSDHVSIGVPSGSARPPAHQGYFSGGHERVEIVLDQKGD